MKSFSTLSALYNSLSNNQSTANTALGKQLINDQHRYLLQKYFDNERSATTQTVGGMSLNLTAVPILGAVSATLTVAWAYPTITQLVNFTNGQEQRSALFTAGSTAITWNDPLVGNKILLTNPVLAGAITATLLTVWTFPSGNYLSQFSDGEQKTVTFTNNSSVISWAGGLSSNVSGYLNTVVSTVVLGTVGVQGYQIPANISKINNLTVNVGQLKFQPKEIMSRAEWDLVNFLPYTSDIPQYYFVYNGKLNIFPIPSTTGNIITYNYKVRVADLSYADYSTGNIAAAGATIGSVAITGTTTAWVTTGTYPANVDLSFQNLNLRIDTPFGDGIWYPIRMFTSGTTLTLIDPIVNAPNITAATTYTIGQFPLLSEDFHDMIVFGALMTYYSSVVPDKGKYAQFDVMYKAKLELLAEYGGTKAINVDLSDEPNPVNPNLFIMANYY